jgi:hypothetical protein
MGVYLAQKIARRDFAHWASPEGSFSEVAASLLMRVVVKTLVDYTGNVQLRGSAELGGLYWVINVFMAVAASFASIKIYYAVETDNVVVEEKTVWLILVALSGALTISSGVFFKLMKKKYRRTFVSTETGNDWAVSFFLKGDTDAKRVKPLRLNEKKWRKIRPQMKAFVLANWERWEEEEPEFFTEVWKSRVPDNMLPPDEMRKQKAAGGGQRRKSSLVGGSVRERRGSATVVPFNEGVDVVGNDDDGAVVVEPTIVRLLDVKEEMDEAGNKEQQQQQQQKSESKRHEDN